MSEPNKSAAASIASEAATQIVVAGGAALATGSTPSAAAIQAAAAAIPGLFSSVKNLLKDRRERKTKKWLEWTLTPDGSAAVTPEQFASFVEENAEEPWVFETILESVRALDEMVSDDAIPPLGRLARSYLSEKKPPDYFYRGFRRLLAESSAEELVAIQEFFCFFITNTSESEDDIFHISCAPPNQLNLFIDPVRKVEVKSGFPEMMRVFHVLRVQGLANDGSNKTKNGSNYQTSPRMIQMSRSVAVRMASYFRPLSTA